MERYLRIGKNLNLTKISETCLVVCMLMSGMYLWLTRTVHSMENIDVMKFMQLEKAPLIKLILKEDILRDELYVEIITVNKNTLWVNA